MYLYDELEKYVGQINHWIETIVPAKKKSVLKGYVWKLKANMVTDTVVKNMFLANWREFKFGMIQNLDQLMDNIHTLYEDLDTEELLFIKVSKLSLSGCDFLKNHPLYILYDDVFNKEKLWDEMGIIYNKWKKKEVRKEMQKMQVKFLPRK